MKDYKIKLIPKKSVDKDMGSVYNPLYCVKKYNIFLSREMEGLALRDLGSGT